MSGIPGNSLSLLFTLPEGQCCKGHEKFSSWQTYMEAHGGPCGLINYWENKISVPLKPILPTEYPTEGTPPPIIPPSIPPTPTPLHSLSPTFLEYQLHESVALSSILINLIDIPGTGVNPRGKSHEAWVMLKEQYGKPSDRTRNMRERDLDECCFIDRSKVAGEGGHIEKMRALKTLANDARASINDTRFKTKLIDSFPQSWDLICSVCYNMKTLAEVISALTSHGERIGQNNPTPPSNDTVKALEASILALQAKIKMLCGGSKPSHMPNLNKSHLVCENKVCGKTGHLIGDCFQVGGGKEGQYPSWWKGK
jgi:hypothetical protein